MDKDLMTHPLLSWDNIIAKKCVSWLLPFQHLYFIPLLFFYVQFLFYLVQKWIFRKRNVMEFCGVVVTSFL